jgi:hypothetical protein
MGQTISTETRQNFKLPANYTKEFSSTETYNFSHNSAVTTASPTTFTLNSDGTITQTIPENGSVPRATFNYSRVV